MKYCIDAPTDISFPDRDIQAIKIPDPTEQIPKGKTSSELAEVRKVKDLVKEAGGIERIEQIVRSLREPDALQIKTETLAREFGGLDRFEKALGMLKELIA